MAAYAVRSGGKKNVYRNKIDTVYRYLYSMEINI
jgi:hypothetical protein